MERAPRKKRLRKSFSFAWQGIIQVAQSQINMKIHLGAALVALGLALWLELDFLRLMWVLFAIFFVLCMEMVNTAIEQTVDLVTRDYHPLAKRAKDMAAGGVLLASLFAFFTGLLVYGEPLVKRLGGELPSTWTTVVSFVVMGILGLILFLGRNRRNGGYGA